jgi:hypothetical protein
MVKNIKEILETNKTGLDEVDVRHWVERYLFGLLGSEVRCSEVDGGKMVLVAESPTVRQELQLLATELRRETLAQTGYKVKKVKVVRLSS